MTHIDTYTHRIPHKLTQLHTNTHILHTFTHKLPHLWVGHKKSHVYIYISIYIYNKINIFILHSLTSTSSTTHHHNNIHSSFKKKFFNQKTKQKQIKSFIHS